MGADDYVPKPFDPREVLARVKTVVQRLRERPPAAQDDELVPKDEDLDLEPASRLEQQE